MNESLRKKIEARAYQLFLKRGGAPGHHMEDWAKAEKEIFAEEASAKSGSAPKVQTQPPQSSRPAQAKKPQGQNRK